jgi:hypothetical protein
METNRRILPSVLLLLLSLSGFLISGSAAAALTIGLIFFDIAVSPSETLTYISIAALAFLTAFLQIPAFINAIRDLQKKDSSPRHASLYKPASYSMILWLCVMAAGYFISLSEGNWLLLAPLTVLGIAIPVWWLIEFGRRKLPRSTGLREWGSLSVGLTAALVIIMVVEILLIVFICIILIFALSTQPGFMQELSGIFQDLNLTQGDLESLEELLLQLAQNPILASTLLLVIGFIAPFIEEFFKPMVIWFLLRHPIKPHEGFSLGMISGGAFALLESAGLVSQIGPEDWLSAIFLRAATGILHIGLSGFVGYGFSKAWPEKRYSRVVVYLLIATGLHGAWNALALINGYSTSLLPAAQRSALPAVTSFLTIALMIVVFFTVIYITLHTNHRLRLELQAQTVENASPNQ